MNVKQKLKETKDFIKRHKKKFVVGTVLVIEGCFLVIFVKEAKRKNKIAANEKRALEAVLDSMGKPLSNKEIAMRNIDEKIFTDLAPRIETLVLEEGLDESYIEEAYTLGEDVIKKVCVHIKKEGS